MFPEAGPDLRARLVAWELRHTKEKKTNGSEERAWSIHLGNGLVASEKEAYNRSRRKLPRNPNLGPQERARHRLSDKNEPGTASEPGSKNEPTSKHDPSTA